MYPPLVPPAGTAAKDEILYAPPPPDSPIAMLQLLSLIMDRLFEIPGTRLRFGVNSLLLVVPVLGDVIPSMVSFAILMIGLKNYRVPRVVAARMMFNSFLDASLGWIPVVGDAFDLFFKADTRNVKLLEQYVRPENQQPPTWSHWLFLGSMALAFLTLLVLVVIGLVTLVAWVFRDTRVGA